MAMFATSQNIYEMVNAYMKRLIVLHNLTSIGTYLHETIPSYLYRHNHNYT
jgi:hypothetical protein